MHIHCSASFVSNDLYRINFYYADKYENYYKIAYIPYNDDYYRNMAITCVKNIKNQKFNNLCSKKYQISNDNNLWQFIGERDLPLVNSYYIVKK